MGNPCARTDSFGLFVLNKVCFIQKVKQSDGKVKGQKEQRADNLDNRIAGLYSSNR